MLNTFFLYAIEIDHTTVIFYNGVGNTHLKILFFSNNFFKCVTTIKLNYFPTYYITSYNYFFYYNFRKFF